jgi:type VI protein secretion system component VasK
VADVAASVDQARNAVRDVTQAFVIEGPAGEVGDRVAVLLESPIEATGGMARGLPAQQANAAAASFCSEFDALTRQYPFTTGGPEASLDDVVAMFVPGEGGLWRYYERSLEGLVERRGSRYEAAPDADPRPSAETLRFFNDAATLSSSLFTPEGDGPELVLGFRMLTSDRLTEVEVNVDGQIHTFTRISPGVQAFQWSADRARNATISGVLDGEPVRLVEPEPGQWALFRLFQIAEWRSLGGSRFAVTWELPTHGLVLEGEVSLNSDTPILSRAFLSGLRCTPRISG